MVTSGLSRTAPVVAGLSTETLFLADQIAIRLKRRYNWIDEGDLRSYAYLGVMLAAQLFDVRRGLTLVQFAARKGLYLAIDEMRKDGIVRRSDSTVPRIQSLGSRDYSHRLPRGRYSPSDGSGERELERIEERDFCQRMIMSLQPPQRRLLLMYYTDGMTFGEIAGILGISESAVCLRHKAILVRLKQMAASADIGERGGV